MASSRGTRRGDEEPRSGGGRDLPARGRHPASQLPDASLPADVAYQIVHDELALDGNSRQNPATFVTTWMEPQAERLMTECFDKNMIGKDEYPQAAEVESTSSAT